MENLAKNTSFLKKIPVFFELLKLEGFRQTPNQWLRIYNLLESCEDITQIGTYIALAIGKSEKDQKRILELFENNFELNSKNISHITSVEALKKPKSIFKKKPKKESKVNLLHQILNQNEYFSIVISSLLSIITLFIFWINFLKNIDYKWIILLVVITIFILGIYYSHRLFFVKKRIAAVKNIVKANNTIFWDLVLPTNQEIALNPTFYILSKRMRERIPKELIKLDVQKTIKKSVKAGGVLQLNFSNRTEHPAYLFLIDKSNKDNQRTSLFVYWCNWLKKRDIWIEQFYFRNDPRFLWKEQNSETVELKHLAELYDTSRLFILGDCWKLLDFSKNNMLDWTQLFLQWNERFVISPIPINRWSWKEKQLSSSFNIVSFDIKGLQLLERHLNPETSFSLNNFENELKYRDDIIFDEDTLPESLVNYCSNQEVHKWIAALAYFPKLNWNLTLFIGETLSNYFNKNLLTFENLRLITRIYWFYNGFIPDNARGKIYNLLLEDETKFIHSEISEHLKKQIQNKEKFTSTQLNKIHLQFLLHKIESDNTTKKENKEFLKTSSNKEIDVMIAKRINKIKNWDWLLDDSLEFLLYESKLIRKYSRFFSNWLSYTVQKKEKSPLRKDTSYLSPPKYSTKNRNKKQLKPTNNNKEKTIDIQELFTLKLFLRQLLNQNNHDRIYEICLKILNSNCKAYNNIVKLKKSSTFSGELSKRKKPNTLFKLLDFINEIKLRDILLEEYQKQEISIKISYPELMPIESGQFIMGSTEFNNSLPVREVKINKFQIGKFQITVDEYLAFVADTNSNYPEWLRANTTELKGKHYDKIRGALIKGDCPIVGVSWLNAVSYCNWLSEKFELDKFYRIKGDKVQFNLNGNGFRLPTEAEWEFAARGGILGGNYKYSGSNDITQVAWYNYNSKRKLHSVGLKKPNNLGIYDMSGNVWEWCWDFFNENYYSEKEIENPIGPTHGTSHVLRGGSWNYFSKYCDVAYRNFGSNVRIQEKYYGFRVVK